MNDKNTNTKTEQSSGNEVGRNDLLAERNTRLLVLVNKAEDLIGEMVSIETPRHVKEETEKFFTALGEYRRDLLS
tara:strand:+ start:439 stop:663 length:225 start_codon:yes stop_codon:yes gene_type:complete